MIQVYDVAGQPVKPKPEKPTPCNELGLTHCWHSAEFQHTIGNHSDWTCCNCGVSHCVRAGFGHGHHGPHAGKEAAMGLGRPLGKTRLPGEGEP